MALGRVSLNVYNEIVSRLLVLGAGVLWLLHGGGLFGVVACYSLADLLSAIVVYALVRRRFGQWTTKEPLPETGIRATISLALAATILVVYSRVDTYLVTLIKGTTAAAYYGSAYRVLGIVTLPALALAQIAIAHTVQHGTERRRTDALRLAMLAAAPTVPARNSGRDLLHQDDGDCLRPFVRSRRTYPLRTARIRHSGRCGACAGTARIGGEPGRYAWVT